MTTANLTHHFLIASPQMPDERFANTLIYICRHDKYGVLGLVVNRPIVSTKVGKLLKELKLNVTNDEVMQDFPLDGGPVFPEVGFVLHTGQPNWASSFGISENVSITTSKDILERIASGEGIEHYHLCLGHASWHKNQLEKEINQGDWLVCPADLELLFETPFEDRWHVAAEKIGVNFPFLSDDIGHA